MVKPWDGRKDFFLVLCSQKDTQCYREQLLARKDLLFLHLRAPYTLKGKPPGKTSLTH